CNDDCTETHQNRTYSRTEYYPPRRQHSCCQWEGNHVISGCPDQILYQFIICSFRQAEYCKNIFRITVNENDVCTIHRDICACTHCDTNICFSQCRCVIDSVTCHCNNQTTFLD